MKQGTYKILVKSNLATYWAYFKYRMQDGIMESKSIDNSFDKWKVISGLPQGAEIIS